MSRLTSMQLEAIKWHDESCEREQDWKDISDLFIHINAIEEEIIKLSLVIKEILIGAKS